MTKKECNEQLRLMKAFIGYDKDSYVVKRMQTALDMAIKALEQTKWIPTSEKPTEGKYLITGAYGKNRYVDIATFDGEDATDTYAWDSYSDEYKVNRREHKVIAYMPFPEQYKAESEYKE